MVVSARSSYYRNRYRSSVQRATQLQQAAVRHRIAEVQRWPRSEVRSFLSDFAIPETHFNDLPGSDQDLLGLPFFAPGFAEMYRPGSVVANRDQPLFPFLTSQYITREKEKPVMSEDPQGDPLISQEELLRIFEMPAEPMSGSDDREVDLDDLEYVAAEVIGAHTVEELDHARPRLRRRLPVLCGLDVDVNPDQEPRFRFQHELFYDQFLAGAAFHLNNGDLRQFHSIMKRSPWRAATISAILSVCEVEDLVDAIETFKPHLKKPLRQTEIPIVRANMGSLWSAIMKDTNRFPDYPIKEADFSDALDLSGVTCANGRFIDCDIDHLTIPEGPDWSLTLDQTIVKKLHSGDSRPLFSNLKGVRHEHISHHEHISQLHISNQGFWERRHDILKELQNRGADVVDAPDETAEQSSWKTTYAKDCLNRLLYRAEASITLKDNCELDDDRLRNFAGDQSAWQDFAKRLDEADLASTESFAAAGSRKRRMRFKVPMNAIQGPHQVDPEQRRHDPAGDEFLENHAMTGPRTGDDGAPSPNGAAAMSNRFKT